MREQTNIGSILRGYRVDRLNIQSVGNMTVIPLVSDTQFTNVADVNEITLVKDRSYNALEFKNASGRVGITIHGWTIMEESQRAQDRTVPYVHLVKGNKTKILPANCIQSRQDGYFNVERWNQEDFMILPPSLKGIALKKSSASYSEVGALWNSLTKWVNGVDCKTQGLTAFYSKFQDKLNLFVAEFEPVKKQLGAITLINQRIVAIDIMPKYSAWNQIWRTLIRDSYGAEAIRISENEGAVVDTPTIGIAHVTNVQNLVSEYTLTKQLFLDEIEAKVNSLTNIEIGVKAQDIANELSLSKIESPSYSGQVVMHGDHAVYLSLVLSGAQPKTKRKSFKSLRNDPYSNSSFSFSFGG